MNVGFIDLGTGMNSDGLPVATKVLVFIIVPLKMAWKMPIAYLLIGGLNANVKSNLVIEDINRLQAVNVRIVSLICDDPSTNFAVGAKLGASLTAEYMKPVFRHPSRNEWVINIIVDAAHMLKLMRNTIDEKGILTDYAGKQIRW